MDDNTAGEDLSVLTKTQTKYVDDLNDVVDVKGRWLELGADIGLLTQALIQNTKISEIDVIEPNQQVHPQLTSSLQGRGQIVSSLDVVQSASYDGVVAIHVLDHITHLDSQLRAISSVLKPGGHVCFVTHNEVSLLRKVLLRRWPPFCLQHPQLFSPESISEVLSKEGFEVIEVKRTTNFFSLRHAALVLFSVLHLPKSLAKIVPPISMPMRLGNIATYARKVN
jgi:2-polyprenyl-3-methyl-5-hydroxy-6-metoxy-1,4-benzoquinol methylase